MKDIEPRSDPHTEAMSESRDALEALAGRLSMEPTADDLAEAVDVLLDAANTAKKLWACEIREEANDARAVAAEARVTQLEGAAKSAIGCLQGNIGRQEVADALRVALLGVVADGGGGAWVPS